MLSTPITEQARQQEWDTICTIAMNNGFPLWIIYNLKNKRIKTLKAKNIPTQTQRKNWITLMYHSPLIHKVINLFKSTELNIAFRTCNTIYNQLHNRSPQTNTDSSGIYRLQCKTCDKSYVGQIGRSIAIRYLEHIQYIRTNIPVSAYALYILNNRHEYGSLEHTIQLLQACSKGKMMNWRDSFYMQVLQQQNLLTEKHKTTEPNPLYALGNITKQHHTTRHTLKTQYILG